MTVRSPSSFEFTPTNVPAAVLDARTVGRDELLDRIVGRIRAAAEGGGKAHTLLIGPRGSGKTHVMTVAAHRAVAADGSKLLVIALTEDAEGVVSYADLLFTMIERAMLDGAAPAAGASATLAAARAARRDADTLEALLRELCGARVVVLVVENLDRVFDDIGVAGQRQLRAFVETWRRLVILASTPLLFPAVSEREEPWFGSFIPEHLTDMDVEEGTRLLIHLATERGDDELASFLAGDRARDRLNAVAHIAGGSPRMWVMLSGCLTAQLLDDLVPLIERLLENLVPYYQSRLRELPGNERKLVVELARTSEVDETGAVVLRPQGARTVTDLAASCGLDRNVASGSLRRLMDARWVRVRDMPDSDRRTSWYELREPLFRHHLQHREAGGGTLAIVVQLLKGFYAHRERVALLGATSPGSIAERHMLASIDAPPASDEGYDGADPDTLLGESRRWDGDRTALGPIARRVAEAAVKGARGQELGEVPTIDRSELAGAAHSAARADPAGGEADRVRAGLVAARELASSGEASTHAELSLLAAGWTGACGDAAGALSCLSDVGECGGGRLGLAIMAERAWFLWMTGDRDAALEDGRAALAGRCELLGEEDPDTLRSRSNIAWWHGQQGDHRAARDEYAAVAEMQERVLGREHPDTLTTRNNTAFQAGELGQRAVAHEELVAVAEMQERVLGREHPHTLGTRHNAAVQAGELGQRAVAREELVAVAATQQRLLGREHPDTLATRHDAAYQAGVLGQHGVAREEFLEVAEARARVLGREHPLTLTACHNAAYLAGELGQHGVAREEFLVVTDTDRRTLGWNEPRAFASALGAAEALARAGDPGAAVSEIFDVYSRVAGDGPDARARPAASLATALSLVDERSGARSCLAAMEALESSAVVAALVTAARDVAGDEARRESWLALWSEVLEDSPYAVVGGVFRATVELLAGRPAMASALPDELRRAAHLLAATETAGE